MNPLDPHLYSDAAKLVAALIVLLAALKKMAIFFQSFAKVLPKVDLTALWISTKPIRQRLVKEFTLPKEYPFAKKVSTGAFAVVFYALTFNCFALFMLDTTMAFFNDIAFWKRIAGVGIAVVILVMARWCLVQAEKSRLQFLDQ